MIKKTLVLVGFIAFAALLISFTKEKPRQQVLKTIVIDAGHGIMPNGGYNGAKGSYSYEDEISLAVSKKLIALIQSELPEVKIVETRPTKYITSLRDRADMANQNRGELFVSIHVNAMPPIQKRTLAGYKNEVYYTGKGKNRKRKTRKVPQYRHYEVPNTSVRGTQTYIWGAHKAEDKEVAIRENAPMLAEENYQQKYGTIDPNSPEFVALSLVKTKQFTQRSATLASLVETEFSKVGRVSGGARQRQVGIWVLQATAMPSILVETGFITNPQEETYLNSEAGQQEIAYCITAAVKKYIVHLEKKQGTGDKAMASPIPVLPEAFLEAFNDHGHGQHKEHVAPAR
ncbi:MAG: N-acetylmuramoyl-L-alanine amidase [Flavisolibacter sp.]|jgi:N-acetylmuramoyl-L-alanine amidase|nr:N-acetylmuramoyl-L-alanine amidase [Flavisolibacter sp.]